MQWPFAKWGAHVVISALTRLARCTHVLDAHWFLSGGHEHFYERLECESAVYIVNGLGGAYIRSWGERLAASRLIYNKKWGALFVDTAENKDSSSLRLQFVTYDGQTADDITYWSGKSALLFCI